MNGDKIFVDTNSVLYLLSGDETLANLLDGKNIHLSFISELELFSFSKIDLKTEAIIKEFLNQCTIIDINANVKQEVIYLRKKYKLKLPDCIIIASSIHLDIPLITSDSDFRKVSELNLLFYDKSPQ